MMPSTKMMMAEPDDVETAEMVVSCDDEDTEEELGHWMLHMANDEKRQAWINGLRELVMWLESHPDIEVPTYSGCQD